MPIFDSHAHYLDESFDNDRDTLLAELFQNGVCGIVEGSTCADSAAKAVELAHRYPQFFATVGIHPEEAGHAKDEDLETLRRLATDKKAAAVGEIGLDYHYEDGCPRDKQKQWFCRQLELAKECGLPVVIHDRDAHEDTLSFLKQYQPRGVVHCFSGSVEMANEIVKLGMYIGIGGVVTFKNARKLTEVAAAIPADRFLLETDAPYLSPEPFRGKRCDSSKIIYTAAAIAALRGVNTETVLQWGEQNARALYNL